MQQIGEFIGWVGPTGRAQEKVHAAVNALQYIEEGLLKDKDFDGLSPAQAEAVVNEARKARTRQEAAARVHQMQAEQAKREVEAAERRREEAERERKRREAEAAAARAARDAEARLRAEAEVKRHEQERRQAEEARKVAVKRQQVATQKAEKFVEEGRRKATLVGRAVSQSIKAGETGIKRAPDVAARVDRKPDQVPPRIEEFAKRLATELNTILDSDRDPRVKKLDQLVQYQEYLDDYTRADLGRTLEMVADRVLIIGHSAFWGRRRY